VTSYTLSLVIVLTLWPLAYNENNNETNNKITTLYKPAYAQGSANENMPLIGINMRGYYTNMPQERSFKIPIPPDYYEQSFRIISQAGINFVRYLFFWESYEKDPFSFLNELETVAQTADRWGVKIIYTNDQYHTSSWLEPKTATGFPPSLFKNNSTYIYGTGGGPGPKDVTAKKWWTEWWNRSVRDSNGIDGWTLQSNFLKKIVNTVDKYKSTLGYEILNEPHIRSTDQWEKVGKYNTFLINEMRTVTKKTIIFDRQVPADLYGPVNVTPENIAKMAPSNTTNVVFKATLYGIPLPNTFAEDRLNAYAKAAQIAGVPLCMCEFNIKSYKQYNVPETEINQTLVNLFSQKFREINAWGWAYWLWNFRPHANTNFNLISVAEDGMIQTTSNFDYIKNLVSNIRQSSSTGQTFSTATSSSSTTTQTTTTTGDTIFPTINITTVNVNNNANKNKISIEGEAFDIGSGVKIVQVKVDKGDYIIADSSMGGDWLHWAASVPVKTLEKGRHEVVATAVDNAGHTKQESVTFNME
jgi:Cellulase (glycosyl hydrolase family 5)